MVCTCGNCLWGWLSPRMKYRLETCAEVSYDLVMDIFNYDHTKPFKPVDIEILIHRDYIPLSIRKKPVYGSYIKGYALCFKAINHLLRNGVAPTPTAILQELRASPEMGDRADVYVDHYLNKGGLTDHALNATIHRSWEEGPGGDDSFADVPEFAADLDAMPACANDNAHELVRFNLGLTNPAINGPEMSPWLTATHLPRLDPDDEDYDSDFDPDFF